MGLPGIKISSIWRVAILLGLSALLYGCVYYKANINEGSFNVNTPTPFWGLGTYIYSDKLYIRGSLSYSIEDRETLPLEGVENEGYKYENDKDYLELLPQEDADIQYVLLKNSFGGSIDILYKKWVYFFGGRIAFDYYPSITLFGGINARYGEAGFGFRLGYSKENARYSGRYGYQGTFSTGTFSWDDSSVTSSFEGSGSYNNANFGIYTFSSLFVTNMLSLNFSTGFYQPWFFRRSIYIGDADIPHDYDITIDFPYLLSQYAGASFIILEHVQFSAGETVFYTPYSDKLHWQTTFSMSYLF